MQRLFVSKRTKAAAIVIAFVLPPLMLGFAYFHAHRPAVHVAGERTVWDYIVMNSDILLGLIFLAACAIPFFLVFEKKKPRARELVPIAVMAALGVVGRTLFSLIPLPNFKPVSAIVIITAVAFGPETGFLTGAVTGFLSNFIFGQGPWTPWQMFCWGMIGFVAGLLETGVSSGVTGTGRILRAASGRSCARTARTAVTFFISQEGSPTMRPFVFACTVWRQASPTAG